ncbi:LOW QUALITY PROTEIN: microtubule-associated protein 4 [Alosa sapidissima]|uniref:LOW QUALITY PROTEIN: microtubule-associated protein 4 n=1 Tax=Alosa sapidissima TaxID=34773 RepID=UPI001C09B640|nr:LOW QUALITY PROTEIN: microtubule-associated protein 4 [Alosa sapidissima]
MDLSLRDALTDGKPQMGSESLLKRDFVAGLEAETFDDKVGEKVGKAEYRPLMDRMDGKKEESSFMSGVHMGGMRLEPQGEKGPVSTVQQNYSADFLSGPVSMMGMPDQWGSQQMGSKMKDNSMDSFMGFPQTGMGMGMSTGLTAVQSGKPSGMAEPPKTSPLFGTEPPKSTQMLGKPNDSNPFNIQDNSVEVWGNPWAGEDKHDTALPSAPSVTTGTSHHADRMEQSPSEPSTPQGSLSQDPASGEEKGSEGGSGSKQQKRKKKKRRHREEVYDLLESLGSPESEEAPAEGSPKGCSSPPSVEEEESWESDIRGRGGGGGGGGGGRIRARRNKSRKKLPEEWGAPVKQGMGAVSPSDPDSGSLTQASMGFLGAEQDSGPKPASVAAAASVPPPPPSTSTSTLMPGSQANTTALSDQKDTSALSAGDSAGKKEGSGEKDHAPFGLLGTNAFSAKDEKMFKQEKADPFSKGDNFNMFEKTDKPEKVEKMDTFEKKEKEDATKKIENVDKTQKSEKIIKDEDKHDKMEKHDNKAEKSEKVDKPEKTNKEKEEKANTEKTDKAAKAEKNEKAGKGTAKSPTANGSKDLVSPDKAKITVGSTKTSASKTRPNSLSTAESAAAQNRTSSAVKPAADKKSPAPKASTPSSGPKRTTPSEAKAKTPDNGTAQKRPSVSKANGAPASRTTTPKNGAPAGTHTARRSSASKAESKPGEAKKPSTAKTTAARPKTSQTPTPDSATPATTNGTPRRSRITKPPVPKQTVPEKKPPVPRAPRKPLSAPMPDLKNVRSKIGSTDNMKYQPGGGRVSASQGRSDALAKGSLSKETSQSKVQIVHKKLDFSHVTSRCGSKDNIKHVPGGGNVQILTKKVDVSKVTAKCGSKDNIKYKPGGGDVKIESHKVNIKAKSKIGSMDNLGHESGVDNGKAEGAKEKAGESPSPPGTNQTAASASMAKENGVKDSAAMPMPVPSVGEGLRDPPQGMDKHITGTN